MPPIGGPPKIPPALLPELFDLSQSLHPGTKRVWSDHQIAAHLKAHHGIEVSHDAVTRALNPLRQVARAAIADAVRSKILERIPDQLEALDGLMDKVRALVNPKPGKKPPPPSTVLAVLDEFRKAIDTKLKFSGIGEKLNVDADLKSDGAALTFYVPKKRDPDDADTG